LRASAFTDPAIIQGFHAHVYYDAESRPSAERLRAALEDHFPQAALGRWHDRPIGPHPCWSYQVAFPSELYAQLVPFLSLNRQGLVVFVHPETGNALADHTDHAMWLGPSQALELSLFG